MSGPLRAAFFDVDETIITVKSMFRFLEFYLRATGRPGGEYERFADQLRQLAATGTPREETNRSYYRAYAGEPVELVRRLGEEWFRTELAGGAFLRTEVVDVLRRHQRAGHVIVLVSGSFPACLDPIARHLDVSRVECTRPRVSAGRYTGAVDVPVIGAAKAEAVRRVTAEIGARSQDCVAYADHVSDAAMLAAVGEAVVVGDDPQLLAAAAVHGWRRLDTQPAASH